jgi:hypothetical protein
MKILWTEPKLSKVASVAQAQYSPACLAYDDYSGGCSSIDYGP